MIDFSDCEFIDDYMKFYTFYDFCDNRYILRILFRSLNRDAKLFYKWYVYANIHTNETYKNAIWDYLNDNETEEHILHLKKLYRAK